jgi:hypothetical protein
MRMEFGKKSLGKISPKETSLPGSNQEWGLTFLGGVDGD